MKRDRESLYLYFQKMFYEYLNPPTELGSDIDGKIWKAAQELSDEAQLPVVAGGRDGVSPIRQA
jgi:hypothetical protein